MNSRFSTLLLSCFLTLPAIAHQGGLQGVGLEFIPNKGQWSFPFLYKCSNAQADIYLENDGFTFLLAGAENKAAVADLRHGKTNGPIKLRYHAYRMQLLGMKQSVTSTSGQNNNYYNYYLGDEPEKWRSGVHSFSSVIYDDVYAGIDLHVGSNEGNMKYDFVVAPGANPDHIQMRFEGADQLSLKDGKLVIKTSLGEVIEDQPYVFQRIDGEMKRVNSRYILKGNIVQFSFPKGYDKNFELVIDPTVIFATFSGSTADNWGNSATYDDQGNFYAGGATAGQGYPTTLGAFDVSYNGGGTGGGNPGFPSDMTITKFNPTGTALIYSTYIGGSDNEAPNSLVVDNQGNLVIVGRTYSNNYPVTTGCFDGTYNGGADLVITKLNPSGTALVGSTYVGGTADDAVNISAVWGITLSSLKHNYGDDARSEVLVDNSSNIYVALPTQSIDFPVTNNAFQGSAQGGQDGAFIKFNPNLTSLIYGTYIGGSADDAAYVLAFDQTESSVYISGGTASSNMPLPAGGSWPAYQGGAADGYILKLLNSGAYTALAATYVGTANYDQCLGIQVDNEDNVYVMGITLGGQFPVSTGVYNNPGSSQFIAKFSNNLSSRIYSTVYGSGNSSNTNISPVAFLVDTCQNVYISGWGGTLANPSGGNLFGMPVTNDAIQSTTNGGGFYFIVLSKNAQSLLYGSFLASPGSSSPEHVDGGTSRFNKYGEIYQGICGGCGGSSSFPTTPGSWSTTNGSANCNYLAVKIAFNLSAVDANASVNPSAVGCPPFTVQFSNGSTNATNYSWDFGDGVGTSSQPSPTYTYNTPGVYQVKLIASNPNACRPIDSHFLTVVVDSNRIDADFTVTKSDSCGPFIVNVTNTSQYSFTPGASTFTKFIWDFGDGTVSNLTNPPAHTYAQAGTYTIKLKMLDSTACNNPDSATVVVNFNPILVEAKMQMPDSLCYNTNLLFANNSVNATSYEWDFGDGSTSTSTSPVHQYAAAGTYTVRLVAINPGSCNKRDTITQTITLLDYPVANFSHAPDPGKPNEPIQFTNLSTGADTYYWAFGDGNSSTDFSPSHLYNRTGQNVVCLEARTTFGCVDTLCKRVYSDVRTVIDVPTAFTPNNDGVNDVLYVEGAAVKSMTFRIYNRWGELIFESNSLNDGWDGRYKGTLQEMETYAYTLEATFIDDSQVQRQGNVSLIR